MKRAERVAEQMFLQQKATERHLAVLTKARTHWLDFAASTNDKDKLEFARHELTLVDAKLRKLRAA